MAVAGRVAIVPKGDWSKDTLYEKLDAVYYLGSSYVAKKSSLGILPTDTEYWMLMVTGTSDEQINQLIEDINALSDEVDSVKEDIANYLPLTGGKVSSSDFAPIVINRTSEQADQVGIQFRLQDELLGEISVKKDGNLRFWDADGKSYIIYGEHNKPNGTYTGNGSATQRSIDIGGIGSALQINYSNNCFAIVTATGAYIKDGTTSRNLSLTEVSLTSGKLVMATTDKVINGTEAIHYWRLL